MKESSRQERHQKGMSTAGIILIVGVFGFLIVTFFKVFPMYYGNFKLQAALESLQDDSAIDPKSKRAIWQSLSKRLFVDDVRAVKRDDVKMERKDGKTTITVTYRTEDSYIGNLYIGANFNESVVIDR